MSYEQSNALLLDVNEYLASTATDNKHTQQAPWMENYGGHQSPFELFAPDPDLFDSELEASADLSQLVDIPFPALDTVQPLPPAAYYGSYRAGPASAFNGTVSSVSESQSGYNDYDTASFYSGHESGYHVGGGSLYGVALGAGGGVPGAVGTLPQQTPSFALGHPSTRSHYGSELDLDFAEFSLSGLHHPSHHNQQVQQAQAAAAAAAIAAGLNLQPGAAQVLLANSLAAPVVPQSTNGAAVPSGPVPPQAIDTAALNSVHLFMNQQQQQHSVFGSQQPPSSSSAASASQSPIDFDALAQHAADMYFPRRGDPLGAGIASSSSSSAPNSNNPQQQQQAPQQHRGAKREATSSPAIPTPDFGLEHHQLRPGKRVAGSGSSAYGHVDDDGLGGVGGSGSGAGGSKRYKCPSCERAFARAYNLKTHMATHDPHRVKSFVCRHQGCGRSFSRKHDLGRHYTSIHGGTTAGGGGGDSGIMSGEERAGIRGHRAGTGSRSGSAYGGASGSAAGGSGSARGGSQDLSSSNSAGTHSANEDGPGGGEEDEEEDSTSTEGEGHAHHTTAAPPNISKGSSLSRSGSLNVASSAGGGVQQRVWCDECGRGWVMGMREACECEDRAAARKAWVVSSVASPPPSGKK